MLLNFRSTTRRLINSRSFQSRVRTMHTNTHFTSSASSSNRILTAAGCAALAIGTYSYLSSADISPAHSLSFWPSSSKSSIPTISRTQLPPIISGGCNTTLDINSSHEANNAKNQPFTKDIHSVKVLKDSEILKLIGNEEKKYILERGLVSEIHTNMYRANYSIEDSYCIIPKMKYSGGLLLGVFDGHGGSAASYFARNELLPYLQVYHSNQWTERLLSTLPIVAADQHFLEFAVQDGQLAKGKSGACLNIVHIDRDQIICANAGDCRALVGRLNTNPNSTSITNTKPQYEAIELSKDHQIEGNYKERERLLNAHPDESNIIQSYRVKRGLQPTRGLGDGVYKDKRYASLNRRAADTVNGWTPPYTTVEPEYKTHTIAPNDQFLVMATDGLYQELDSQAVVDYVSEYMNNPELRNSRTASSYLIEKSLLAASEYQHGRRSKKNLALSWILGVPPAIRRGIHDDVTVIVVFFDSQKGNVTGSSSSSSSLNGQFEGDGAYSGGLLQTPPSLERAIAQAAQTANAGSTNSQTSIPIQAKL